MLYIVVAEWCVGLCLACVFFFCSISVFYLALLVFLCPIILILFCFQHFPFNYCVAFLLFFVFSAFLPDFLFSCSFFLHFFQVCSRLKLWNNWCLGEHKCSCDYDMLWLYMTYIVQFLSWYALLWCSHLVWQGQNPVGFYSLRNHWCTRKDWLGCDILCQEMIKRNLPGYAIGGLSGGEAKGEFWRVVEQCTRPGTGLPEQKPRYLMGVGYPLDIVICVALGVDMFDCVYPCRTARFGTALVRSGQLRLTSAEFANDFRPPTTCSSVFKIVLLHIYRKCLYSLAMLACNQLRTFAILYMCSLCMCIISYFFTQAVWLLFQYSSWHCCFRFCCQNEAIGTGWKGPTQGVHPSHASQHCDQRAGSCAAHHLAQFVVHAEPADWDLDALPLYIYIYIIIYLPHFTPAARAHVSGDAGGHQSKDIQWLFAELPWDFRNLFLFYFHLFSFFSLSRALSLSLSRCYGGKRFDHSDSMPGLLYISCRSVDVATLSQSNSHKMP